MGAYGVVHRLGDGVLGHAWRPGRLLPGIVVIAAAAMALETYGVGVGAYAYGGWPLKVSGVPLGILLIWLTAGVLSWRIAATRGIITGVATTVALDMLVIEPIAHYAHLWWWTSSFTPHLGPLGTVGNTIAWTGMCLFGLLVMRRVHPAPAPRAPVTAEAPRPTGH